MSNGHNEERPGSERRSREPLTRSNLFEASFLLGLDELAEGAVRLKDMARGGEEDVAAADLPALVAARLESEA